MRVDLRIYKFITISMMLVISLMLYFYGQNLGYHLYEAGLRYLVVYGILCILFVCDLKSEDLNLGYIVLFPALYFVNDIVTLSFLGMFYCFIYADRAFSKYIFFPAISYVVALKLNIVDQASLQLILLSVLIIFSTSRPKVKFLYIFTSLLLIKLGWLSSAEIEGLDYIVSFSLFIISLFFKSYEVAISYILFVVTGHPEAILFGPIIERLNNYKVKKFEFLNNDLFLILLTLPFMAFVDSGNPLTVLLLALAALVMYKQWRSSHA